MRRGLVATIGVLVLALGGGCGEGGSEGAPAALEGSAAEEALADAARITNEVSETVEGRVGISITGTPAGDQEFTLDVLADPSAASGSFEASSEAGSFELLLLGDSAYLTSDEDAFVTALPEGVEWIELSPQDLQSLGLETFFGDDGFSPQLYLVLGAADVQPGDAGEVGGDAVRSYSFSIDEDEAVAEAPEEVRGEVEDAITLEGDAPTIEGSASIDAEGRLRRFAATGTVQAPPDLNSPEQLEVTLEIEFSDFGVEVPTDPPSEEVTVPLDEAPGAVEALSGIFGGDPG